MTRNTRGRPKTLSKIEIEQCLGKYEYIKLLVYWTKYCCNNLDDSDSEEKNTAKCFQSTSVPKKGAKRNHPAKEIVQTTISTDHNEGIPVIEAPNSNDIGTRFSLVLGNIFI